MAEDSIYILVNPLPVISGVTGALEPTANSSENYVIDTPNGSSTYSWQVTNGTIASGQNTNAISVDWADNMDGQICVTETDENGCESDPVCISISIVTTPVLNIKETGIKIYPNPGKENLFIELPDNLSVTNLSIMNASGQQLIKQEWNKDSLLRVNIQSLPTGTYTIRLKTDQGWVFSKFLKI